LTKSQFDSLAEELADLLKWDPLVLRAYTFLLSKNGQVKPHELAAGLGTDSEETKRLLDAMEADGLTVNGDAGLYPVHPRLGISNVYRLSAARDPSVSAIRPRVDSLISILASYRDRVEDRQFAEPPRDGSSPPGSSTPND
jgi:hypothetical protein